MSGERCHFQLSPFLPFPPLPCLFFPPYAYYYILNSENGNKKIAKLALKYGCDINVVNNGGKTALHFARRYGHMELGQYLITKGADEREST